jgi:hypothetical protein
MRNITILLAAVLAVSPAMATTPVGIGDHVTVNKATLACPKLSDMRRTIELYMQDEDAAIKLAKRRGCRQILEQTVGVVWKSGRPTILDCLRPQGERDCIWIPRLRLTVIKKAVLVPVDYDPFAATPPQRKAEHLDFDPLQPDKRRANALAPVSGPFPAVTSSSNSRFAVGAQIKVKLPALACPNVSDFIRIVELTIQNDNDGLQKFSNSSGCLQFPMGTVAAVEQEDNNGRMVCIRPRNEIKCLWTDPSLLISGVN